MAVRDSRFLSALFSAILLIAWRHCGSSRDYRKTPMAQWPNSQRRDRIPPIPNSRVSQFVTGYPKVLSPSLKRSRLIISLNPNSAYSILDLLSRRRPSAILFRVTFGAVNPIYRSTFWLLTHIFKKDPIVIPLLTHGNALSDIVFHSRASLSSTSASHPLPRHISSCLLTLNSVAMPKIIGAVFQ